MRYRRLPPGAVLWVFVTALVFGQGVLQVAVEQYEADGPAAWSVSAQYDTSEQVRDQWTIVIQLTRGRDLAIHA